MNTSPGRAPSSGASACPAPTASRRAQARADRLALPGRERAADVHDLVRFRGLAVAYDDVVDVNLRVWGDEWPGSLGSLAASIQLPGRAELSPLYRVWGSPAWVRGVVSRFPQKATLRASQIPAHQFVELRVVFPRDLLTSTSGAQVRSGNGLPEIVAEEAASQRAFEHDRERIDDAKGHPGPHDVVLLLIGFGPALGLMTLVWLVYGRERRTGYDREYEQEPPTDTEPALVPSSCGSGPCPDRTSSPRRSSTSFAGAATRRRRSRRSALWGGLRHENIADLEVTLADPKVETAPFEEPVAKVVDWVVDTEGKRPLSSGSGRAACPRCGTGPRPSRPALNGALSTSGRPGVTSRSAMFSLSQAAPQGTLRRDRRRLVAAAPNEVEERRGELVRSGLERRRRSGGTRAGSGSVGGSCSYSRS